MLALECGAPPGGRSTTGRKAAVAQRPTSCEAEGRAIAKWGGARREDSIMVRSSLKLNALVSDPVWADLRFFSLVAEDQKWGVPDRWSQKYFFLPHTFDLEAIELLLWVQ